MFRNVKLKRFLKKTIFPVFSLVNKIVPKREDYILLYSANNGICYNLKPLYDYLLDQDYASQYKIICGVENLKYAEKENRVIFVDKYRSLLYFMRAGHVYYTTGQIPIKPSEHQTVIQLDHGTTDFKACGKLSKIHNGEEFYFTYYTAPSEIYRKIVCAEYGCRESNIVINGEPVLDDFYRKTENYDLGSYKKTGLWAPTFRQSDYIGYDDSDEELIPMYRTEDYKELNDILEAQNIKLLVKLHSGQNLNDYRGQAFSNLELLSDEDFTKKGYRLYSLLKQVDFLLADYSSVFLQFLLLDKPIGFVVPDMEEYAQRRGFVFENPVEYMPGEIIRTKSELYQFLDDMQAGRDRYKEERHRVCSLIHTYKDGGNTKRALEFGGIALR